MISSQIQPASYLKTGSTPTKDNDLIELFLNNRQRTDFTEVDKLLDVILNESLNIKSDLSTSDERTFELTKENEETAKYLKNWSAFDNVNELAHDISVNTKQIEKPLENLFFVKQVRRFFNFRAGSLSEAVVNGFFTILHILYWTVTHPNTRFLLSQLTMKIFELFLTLILVGIMIVMSIITIGKDLCNKREKEKTGKEIVKIESQPNFIVQKPSRSSLDTSMDI